MWVVAYSVHRDSPAALMVRSLTRLSEYRRLAINHGGWLIGGDGLLQAAYLATDFRDKRATDFCLPRHKGLTPAGSPPQAMIYSIATTSFQCLNRIPMLTAVQTSVHSCRTASSPRCKNRRTPRTCLISPIRGSTVCFRNA